ncbi:MAG: PD-(D/E)XK nuclease family protein [Bacteroidota bacterium]|jgi:CRISPR/Cas system-associated exonuclease Cas4 (RecB family)
MNERIVLSPHEHLVETVAAHLSAQGRDFSTSAVVFPGKRPAHFLRKELARRIGGSFIPPKIFSVDEFILSLYQKLHALPVKDLESIDAVVLLYQIHSELKERLGGEYFASLEAFLPIGLKLFSELEELHLANLTEQKIKESLSSLTYNRLFSLAEYYTRFYALVEEKGFTTRAVRYSEVADRIGNIDLGEYTQLIVAGLYKQTHAEKIIFDDLANRQSALFVFQTDKTEPGTKEPEIHFYKSSDTHGQVFALSAIINDQLEKNKLLDERSVIVLPTADALFPVVHQTLTLMPEEEYNIALGYPMARTPVYGFLHNLMELVCTKQGERYSASQYLKFVLHPYTKNIRFGQRADVTRILFHGLETMLMEDKTKILVTLEDIEQADEVFNNAAFTASESGTETTPEQLKEHLRSIHMHTIRALDSMVSLKEFSHKAIEVLTYIYEYSTAHLHPLFRPYAEAFLQMFLHLEQSLAGGMPFRDASGYFSFLQQYVAQQEVPFSGTPLRGLQVLGLLETRSLHFDDVYLLNANDHVLPGGIGSDMLLPQKLRENLQLETHRDRDKLSEHYFNLLVRGAKRVHLFFSESGESSKSRFIEQLLWERQKRDGTYSSDHSVQTIRYQVKLANDAVPAISKSKESLETLRGFSYSSSALDTYMQCPIKFYYRYIMRLKEKEEATEDIDSQEIGKFVHEVLKKFYEPLLGKKLNIHDLDIMRMEQLVNEFFSEKFGTEPVGASYLLKRQIQRQLKALLTNYQKSVIEVNDVIIQRLEEKISVNAFGVKFEGKLDRIEQRSNSIVILDYKTGVPQSKKLIAMNKLDLNERESWSEAIPSLQLPIYLLLYRIHSGLTTEEIIPAFLYIGESRLSKEGEIFFVEDSAERALCFTQVQKVIELLLQEMNNAAVPFSPPADLRKACHRCPYTALCGTSWVQR